MLQQRIEERIPQDWNELQEEGHGLHNLTIRYEYDILYVQNYLLVKGTYSVNFKLSQNNTLINKSNIYFSIVLILLYIRFILSFLMPK